MKYGDKLYIVVRKDLKPGIQLAQALHAALHFSFDHRALCEKWMNISDHICVLHIDNEEELQKLLYKANSKRIVSSTFNEPDLDNSLTAICFEPGIKSKSLCKNLKLAFA